MEEGTQSQGTTPKISMNMVLVGVIVLVFIGGGFFLFSNKVNTPQPASQASTPTQTQPTQEPTQPVTQGEVKTFTVTGKPFSFDVKEIKVKKGDTVKVVFTNTQGTHNWVLDEFGAQTKVLQAGASETVEFVADKAGTFEYYCSVGEHRQNGMVGKLIVE